MRALRSSGNRRRSGRGSTTSAATTSSWLEREVLRGWLRLQPSR